MFPSHPGKIFFGMVIQAAEVEQPVEDVGQDFLVQAEALGLALFFRHGRADEDFPMVEGDDVGGGGVLEEIAVDPGDCGGGEQGDFDVFQPAREAASEAGGGGFSLPGQSRERQWVLFLPVVDRDPDFPSSCGLWGIRSGHGACSSGFR